MESKGRQKRKKSQVTDDQDSCVDSAPKSSNLKVPVRRPPLVLESQLEIPSTKIKLQLFPLNDLIQVGLEKEGYNPYLELTLSARKRISSVVKHVNSKWQGSSVAKGQLMLFPYDIKLEDLHSCTRWTSSDTIITAWEVYAEIGSPSIFRYGWQSSIEHEACGSLTQANAINPQYFADVRRTGCSKVMEMSKPQDEGCEPIIKHTGSDEASNANGARALGMSYINVEKRNDVAPGQTSVLRDESFAEKSINNNQSDPSSAPGEQPIGLTSDVSIGGFFRSLMSKKISDPPEMESSPQTIILVPSDISVGGLLSEVSLLSDTKLREGRRVGQAWDNDNPTACLLSEDVGCGNNNESKPTPHLQNGHPVLLSDSLDNLVATHMKNESLPQASHMMSILDAEDTCHPFPVHRVC